MNNKSILYIGGFEMPDKNAAAHRVINNAKILKCIGYDVIFVGVSKDNSIKSDILATKKEVFGFDVYEVRYPKNTLEWIKAMVDISSYIKILKNHTSIEGVILYNFHSIAFERIRHYCRKNNVKCYADVTEWYTTANEKSFMKIIKGFDTWYRMVVIQKKLDGLIVISRYLEKYYSECKNVVYIPALVDIKQEKWINQYSKNTNKLQIVYAGNPGKKDRIDYLIRALECVRRSYQLDVIGMTKEQYLDYYPSDESIISSHENIVFHGRLPHLNTLEYVKQANYSCFFREDDRVSRAGFPTKFAEALSCGTPVLTNSTSNLSEYIKNNENGVLIENLTPDSIANVIENLPITLTINKSLLHYESFIDNMKGLF